jgi:hypothetical protein
MLDGMILDATDELLLAWCGNKAANWGLPLTAADDDKLRMTPGEREALRSKLPFVTPFLEKYAHLLQYAGLFMFGLSLLRMANVRSTILLRAAKENAKKEKRERAGGSRDDEEEPNDFMR